MSPRTDGELHFEILLKYQFTIIVRGRTHMKNAAVSNGDLEQLIERFKRIMEIASQRRRFDLSNGFESSSHWMEAVGLRMFGVALCAGLFTHIRNIGMDVLERTGVGESRIW